MDILFASIGNRFYFDTRQFIMKIYNSHNCFFSENIDKVRFIVEFCFILYSGCRTKHDVIIDLSAIPQVSHVLKALWLIQLTRSKNWIKFLDKLMMQSQCTKGKYTKLLHEGTEICKIHFSLKGLWKLVWTFL